MPNLRVALCAHVARMTSLASTSIGRLVQIACLHLSHAFGEALRLVEIPQPQGSHVRTEKSTDSMHVHCTKFQMHLYSKPSWQMQLNVKRLKPTLCLALLIWALLHCIYIYI